MTQRHRRSPTRPRCKSDEARVKKTVSDQADGLRRLMLSSPGRLVSVVGSDPVSVASVTSNLAAALVQQGKEVLLLDEHNGSQTDQFDREQRLVLINAVLDKEGALSRSAAQADNIVVVLRANAASITESYACIKRLHYAHALQRLHVLVNGVADAVEAQRILANLVHTGKRYLGLAVESAGWVRADPLFAQAQRLNLTVVEAFQASPAATDFRQIATDLLQWPLLAAGGRPASRLPATMVSQNAGSRMEMR